MGAGSSFPAVLSQDHAKLLCGESWQSVEQKWPEGKTVITREELEALVKSAPEVEACTHKLNWDEVPAAAFARPAGATGAEGQVAEEETVAPEGQVVKQKVETAKREQLDVAAKRREQIAIANGVDLGDESAPVLLVATPQKAKQPRAPSRSGKRSAQRKIELQLMRSQRKAAMAAGGGAPQPIECQLYVKPPKPAGAQSSCAASSSNVIEIIPIVALPPQDPATVSAAPAPAPERQLQFDVESAHSVGLPSATDQQLDGGVVSPPAAPQPLAPAAKTQPPIVASPRAATTQPAC